MSEVNNPVYKSQQIHVPEIGDSTYPTLQDFINNTISSGFVSGGAITDNDDGTVAVAAGTGYIRLDSSSISILKAFDWAAVDPLDLDDDALNYVYVDYNGGDPEVAYTTDISGFGEHTDKFIIGLVYQESDHAHISVAGQRLNNYIHRAYFYAWEYDGIQRANGLVTSEDASEDLAINITAGAVYWALARHAISAFDSSTDGANQEFELFYRDGGGGWTDSMVHALPNTQYDDGSGTLQDLTANRYGVYWLYTTIDGFVYAQYGQGDYTLAQALAAAVPATMTELQSVGVFIAKIIIQKSATDFYGVYLPWTSTIGSSPATDHGGLAGLLDPDHINLGDGAGNIVLFIDGSQNVTIDSTHDGGSVLTIDNTTASVSTDTYLLDLKYVDDEDANAYYIRCVNDSGSGADEIFTVRHDAVNGVNIKMTNTNAFKVEQADGTDVFEVDTGATPEVIAVEQLRCDNHMKCNDDPFYFYDTSNNEALCLNIVGSAANYAEIANATTGNAPELNAAGSDTNIDFEINPKGTGGLIVTGGASRSEFDIGVQINTTGADSDTYIEGDTDTALFHVDAGNDRIGISTAAPDKLLHVAGDMQVDGDISKLGYFFAYRSSEQAGSTTPTTLDCDTVVIADADYYSEAAGLITIQKDGLYKISYAVTFDIDAGTRYFGWAMIYVGISELVYSRSYGYGRETAASGGTATNSILVSLNSGDVVSLKTDVPSTNMDIGGVHTQPATLMMEYIRDDS